MSQMLKSSGAMGLATLLSRVLGVVRESLYAAFMGDTAVAGAFKLAFMIPNLFRRLLGEGALTAAFIPIFKEKERIEGPQPMWAAANAVISGLILSASGLVALVMLGLTVFLALDAGASPADPILGGIDRAVGGWFKTYFAQPVELNPDTRLMLELARLMFPYMLTVCLAAIFMGILNARGRFFVPAMGTFVLNLLLILTVLFVAPRFGASIETQIFALALGVLVAGVSQAAYQLPSLRREGFQYRWVTPWKNETVRQVVSKMVPGMLGVAAFQVNVLVTQSVAFGVDAQIIASFDYAVRLMEFPQGLFGISLATYLLPTLAGLAADKNFKEFRGTLRQALGYLALANVIASVLLLVLARPIIRLLFERGEFNVFSTERTAFALQCLAPGLIAFSMNNILARAFYAVGDTATPMKISSVCLGLNLVFVLWLIHPLAQGGMGLANTMSASFNLYFLLYALRRKLGRLELTGFPNEITRITGAALLSGIAAALSSMGWERQLGHDSIMLKVGGLFVPALAAGLVYAPLLIWLRVPPALELFQMVRRRFGKGG